MRPVIAADTATGLSPEPGEGVHVTEPDLYSVVVPYSNLAFADFDPPSGFTLAFSVAVVCVIDDAGFGSTVGAVFTNTHPAPTSLVVAEAPDQRRVAFGGERDAVAELAFADLSAARQLRALLGPGRARVREHPCRADVHVVVGGRRSAAVLPLEESATL